MGIGSSSSSAALGKQKIPRENSLIILTLRGGILCDTIFKTRI